MFYSALRRSIAVVLLTAAITHVSGFQTLKLKLDRRASYNFSNNNVRQLECPICVGNPPNCKGSVLLNNTSSATVQFRCLRPEDAIHVEIRRDIACTDRSCDGDIVVEEEEPGALEGVSRALVWTLEAPQAFLIEFAGSGLRQIDPSQACPDQNTYTLRAVGGVAVGTYCRTGPVAAAQVLSQGTFSLRVPAKKKLQAGRFNVTVCARISSLAKIKVVLSAGDSTPMELFSPNYPQSFPDDDLVMWDFWVPAMHNATVRVVHHTQPACRKKLAAVEYHSGGRSGLVLGLADPQPTVQHSFTMTLKNCEMDSRRTTQGLSLRFRVTTVPSSLPVLCTVDLRKEQGLSLTLEKAHPGSKCEMKVDNTAKTKVLVSSNSVAKLSFQDCSQEDVWVTASRVIECSQLKKCPKMPFPLRVPALPACLPVPLRSVTWSLVLPAEGSLALLCPSDGLRQTLPGQNCNGSTVIAVAEDNGRASVGRFCARGPIQSIQVRTNVSVTASGDRGLPQSLPVLSAHFKGEIAERYVFTVSPKVNETTRLASPGWPAGMKSHSTVSWIVNVPAKKEARLAFVNLSRPLRCSDRHSNIRVQLLGSPEEMYSRREDEDAETQQVVPGSFYLNMSNCMPEKGQLSVVTEITLSNSRNLLLTIILSVVSVLLVLAAVVLTVVCVVIRKKKKAMSRDQVSIYNPAGTVFRPGESHRPGSEEDEYHVYASIEDTLVYTHLLKKELELKGLDDEDDHKEEDAYRPFTGPTEPPRPPSSVNPEVGTYRPFPGTPHVGPPVPRANRPASRDQTMVHNGLYDPDGQSDLGVSEDDAAAAAPPALGTRMEPEGSD